MFAASVSDPNFDRKPLPSSWGGPANCDLAIRALLWMEHCGRTAELRVVMERWLHIVLRHGFYWQVDRWTGDPSVAAPDISFLTGDSMVGGTVCWLAYLDFTRRLVPLA